MNIKKYFRIKYYREISNLKYQFFRKEDQLNLKSKIGISKKIMTINKKIINEINNLLNEYNYINKDSMWYSILNNHHIKFLNFVKNNKNNLKYALDNPHNFNIFYGFDDNCKALHDISGFNFKYRYSKSIIDKLLSFCEFLGILKLDNPEYTKKVSWFKYRKTNCWNWKKIKIKLKFNNPFPKEKGIITSRGILSIREIQAIYQAYRSKK